MTDTTDNLVTERGNTHGDFDENAIVTQYIKELLRGSPGWVKLTPAMRESLDLISTKIGRIMAGAPTYVDHWDDISGYARLISLRLNAERKRRIKGQPTVAEVVNGKVTIKNPTTTEEGNHV